MKNARKLSKVIITSNFSFSQSVFKRLVLQTPKKQGFANNKYGIIEVDYYFYAAKTQKGNDGIVLFENYGLIFFLPEVYCSSLLGKIKCMLLLLLKLIEVQNAHLTKADMYP